MSKSIHSEADTTSGLPNEVNDLIKKDSKNDGEGKQELEIIDPGEGKGNELQGGDGINCW